MLLKTRFSVRCIAELLHVSSRMVGQRMHEFGLSVRAFYTEIHNSQFDDIVRDIQATNSGCGSKMLVEYLGARSTFLPGHRIRESLFMVDPLADAA